MRYFKLTLIVAAVLSIFALSPNEASAVYCIKGTVDYGGAGCSHYTAGDRVDIYYRPTMNDAPVWYGWRPIGWNPGTHTYRYDFACPIDAGYYRVVFTIQAGCNPEPERWIYGDNDHFIIWDKVCCDSEPTRPEGP